MGRTTIDTGLDEFLGGGDATDMAGILDEDFDAGDAWAAQEFEDTRMVAHAIRSEEDRWDVMS